ncbi:MAG: ABC transporter ATP-binding protein/permease [Aeromicrobium sp.]|uniref:ABC transporter ATP-binding protein n=1 Tax=Aeromicrobium sp. TaxID=1871063 RepID=UPI0039E47382
MINAILAFVDDPALRRNFLISRAASAIVRAAVVMLLFPTATAFFGPDPADGFGWLAALAASVLASWWVDQRFARDSFAVGFHLRGTVEEYVLARLEAAPLTHITPAVSNAAQRAMSNAGYELCSAFVYVLAPVSAGLWSTVLIGFGLLFINPWLALAALVAAGLLALSVAVSGRLVRHADDAFGVASEDVGEQIVAFAQAQRVLRASRQATGSDTALARALDTFRSASLRLVVATVPGTILFSVVSQLALAGVAVVAVVLADRGDLSSAEVVALVVVALRFLEPFFTITDLAPAVESARGGLERVERVLDLPALPPTEESPAAGDAVLQLENVTFAYPQGPDVLTGIDLSVARGRTLAIVGPSGSGKSTVLALAARFADPRTGTVRIDGRDVREVPLPALMERVSAVFQQVYLVDDTLRENLRMARRDATDAEIAEAATSAQLDEVVARLPHGWKTRIGEGGRLLSGGERQRVSVARALLKRAPLLLLDEATSAVDAQTETALVAALGQGAADRATVVVAHRLSTIAGADEICFLEAGRIVERGTFAELQAAGGRFADYWRQREAAASWRLTAHR